MTEESVLTAPPRTDKAKPAPPRLAKFAAVGALGVLLNTAALYLLYEWLHLPLLVASAMAIELAVVNNYLLNDHWTFASHSRSVRRFVRFNVSSLGGVAINLAAVALLTAAGWHVLAADLVGIAAGFVVNFVLSSAWVWTPA